MLPSSEPRENGFVNVPGVSARLITGQLQLFRHESPRTVVFVMDGVDDGCGPDWKLWQDKDATWINDELFLPPVNLSRLPVNPPGGGWSVLESGGRDVSVPGTVEEYLHPGKGPAGDFKGVSWWWRTIRIPENAGAHIVLRFESQRQRAEIYLDHQLVGYDVIGGTPFEADLTGKVKPGQECQLAVRITDPGGNFDWRDSSPFSWGTNKIPMSHGFGGITGPVKLVATAAG